MKSNTIGVVGAGAWGTALAQSVTKTGMKVVLWAHEEKTVQDINQFHQNRDYLPDIMLDDAIHCTASLEEVSQSDILLLVPPAQAMRQVGENIAPFVKPGCRLLICSKGIEQSSGKLLTDVVQETVPQAVPAILSGPSFAAEVARDLPTAVTLACDDEKVGTDIIQVLGHRNFRPYWSGDMLGAQIGGAVKNVLAIAAGIVAGKEIGASAHAALITRGFAELVRFGVFHNAHQETLRGLSGLGDLILTCSSIQSRNMSLGHALGQGQSLDDILSARNSVSEGIFTAGAVAKIAQTHRINMPICSAVHAIITKQTGVDEAIEALLSRPFKKEEA